jgi:hypothetical protein
MSRIYGNKNVEVTGGKMRGFIILYYSPIIFRKIKSRRIRLAGYETRMEGFRKTYKVWV